MGCVFTLNRMKASTVMVVASDRLCTGERGTNGLRPHHMITTDAQSMAVGAAKAKQRADLIALPYSLLMFT